MSARGDPELSEWRNPGPSWGYGFLRLCDRVLPEAVFRPLRAAGTAVALVFMGAQRRHSRAYLAVILGRPASTMEVFRHFLAFEEVLMLRLRLLNGRDFPCRYDPSGEAFMDWFRNGGPVLLGTFHVGVSDMLGFQVGSHAIRRMHIVRRRVGNSPDTEGLARLGGGRIQFIWTNEPAGLIASLLEAAATGEAIAMQCDRIDNAAQTAAFEFLGERRLFPVTIYRLAHVLRRPVILTVGLPVGSSHSRLVGSPRFEVAEGEGRAEALARGRDHFQAFLRTVEALLREHPYQWFNFIPLNPAPGGGSPAPSAR